QTDEDVNVKDDANHSTSMSLKNLSYHYPGHSKKAIDQLSLDLVLGNKLAILGKSGMGKSTLLKLMAGVIQPDEGQVLVNGQPMSSNFLSKTVSVLNQKPHLFDTTIKNNIRMGNPQATDQDISAVVKQTQLTHLISSLPHGLNTSMEEMVQRFSGWMIQRISIDVVYLQNSIILLIKLSTIRLNSITEKEVLNTILKATKNKTIIWVTQHLAGIEKMDQVIFLENGRIVMKDSHDVLLQSNERYQKLYQMDRGISGG